MQKRKVYSAIIVLFVSFVRIPWASALSIDELSENPPPPAVVISDDYQCSLERSQIPLLSAFVKKEYIPEIMGESVVFDNVLCQTERMPFVDFKRIKKSFGGTIQSVGLTIARGIGLGFYNYVNFYVSLARKFLVAPVNTVIYDILRPLKDTLLVCCKGICLAVTDWNECSQKTAALIKEITKLIIEKPEESIGIVVECLLPFAGASVYRRIRSVSALHKTVTVVDQVKQHKALVTVTSRARQTISKIFKRPISWSGVNVICSDAINVFCYSQSYRCYFLIEAHNLVKNSAAEVIVIAKRPLQLAAFTLIQEPLLWFCNMGDFLEDIRRFFRGMQRRKI